MREYFSLNLKQLCRHYRSIADVCRKLNFNRGQFNRYLSGHSFPTAYNMKRICDFFGLEEVEIVIPPEQFAGILGRRSALSPSMERNSAWRAMEHLKHSSSLQARALKGYYYEYGHAMSDPGHIQCSLVHIREDSGYFVYERNERVQMITPSLEEFDCYRYAGVMHYLQDRIFLTDYETLTSNQISQTILIPSFRSRITRMNGLKIGVSACDRRTPVCSRVVWDFLGSDIDVQNTYRGVRLYREGVDEIDNDVKHRLNQCELVDGLFRLSQPRRSR